MLTTIATGGFVLLVKAALFVVLSIVIYRVLGDTSFGAGRTRLPLALAIEALCVLSLGGSGRGDSAAAGGWTGALLMPYAALTITLLLLPLVFLVLRFVKGWVGRKPRSHEERPARRGETCSDESGDRPFEPPTKRYL